MTETSPALPPSYQLSEKDFARARERIRGLVHRTPLFSSRSLSERTGSSVWLKAENLQKTGSFKTRGVFNKVLQLSEDERGSGIITASAGNNGQAVAYVAAHQGIPGVVVMPEGANRSKVAAVKEYGAEAILHGNVWDDAYNHSMELAAERGLTYVHPFKDPHIMAGQGTIAFEILEDLPNVSAVFVPIGGGGLIAGIASAFRLLKPDTRIIGVEPTGAPNMTRSRESGSPVELDVVDTKADGLATRSTDPDVFPIIEQTVAELVTVTDDEMVAAVQTLLERAKLMAEVSGAASTAALLSGRSSIEPGSDVAVVVSGGNFDVAGKLDIRL